MMNLYEIKKSHENSDFLLKDFSELNLSFYFFFAEEEVFIKRFSEKISYKFTLSTIISGHVLKKIKWEILR